MPHHARPQRHSRAWYAARLVARVVVALAIALAAAAYLSLDYIP